MKWFLDQDNSSHWYLVQAHRRADWNTWQELDEDDEAGWEPPPYAIALGGSPSQVEFETPTLNGESLW